MSEGCEVWVFDVQSPDRSHPKRGVVHEVHQPTAADPVLRVSGAMQLNHDDMVRSSVCFKPFLKQPVVDSFTVTDPVMAQWPHYGKFAALAYTSGSKA